MEVHLLGREEAPADMQLALRAGGLRTPALDRLGAMDLVVSGLARGLSAHLGGNLDAALAGWLRQGARLDEALLLVRTGAVTMRAEGALAVDPADGLLSGEGTLAVTDIAALLRSFGLDDERLPAIAAGAALAGRPGEVDGQPALVFEYRIADGRLSVAGFQLFDIPPVQDWE